MLKKERKWNHVECSVKTTKGRTMVEDQNRNKQGNRWEIVSNMVDMNSTLSKIIWNSSVLNAPIKG